MRRRPTLLTMLLVPLLLTITVGLLGFGLYLDGVQSESRLADIDEELVRAGTVGEDRAPPASGPSGNVTPAIPPIGAPTPETPSDRITEATDAIDGALVDPPIELIIDLDGNLLRSTGGANPFSIDELTDLATRSGPVTSSDGRYRVLVSDIDLVGGATARELTALPLDGFNDAVADFRRSLVAAGLVVIALEALIIVLVARAVSHPVARMTSSATRIADGELDTTLGEPSGSREIAQLSIDLERMLDRLRSTLAVSESSAADARSARDQMERFLADVSHEFRTPLTALHGYSDLYANGMLDDAAVERAMQRMGSESARLNSLVNDMMQLARRHPNLAEPEEFDIAVVIDDVVDDLRSAHVGRTVAWNRPIDLDSRIAGIPGQIHQALINLGANALGHSDGGVAIRLSGDDMHLAIAVIDHGPGIAEADRERIFQPFVRLDASRTRTDDSGAGLGLALTSQIAAGHQGTITVGDTPGGGATVTLRLPRPAR